MSIVAFDTLKFANQLQAGNFTAEQAQAMTSAMVEAMAGAELATKSDLVAVRGDIAGVEHRLEKKIDSAIAEAAATKAELKADIAWVKAELKADIAGVEHRLEQKIDGVKAELKANIAGVEQKISESQIGTQRFILTAILSAMALNAVMVLGAMFGLVKLLGH